MKWHNLTQNLCPKCGGHLKSDGGLLDPIFFCADKCGFTIGESKIDMILRERHQEIKKEEERRKAAQQNSATFMNMQPSRKDLKVKNFEELKNYHT